MIKRFIWLTALPLLLSGFLLASSPPGERRPAPFYSLPADGTWAEFDWSGVGPGDLLLRGKLRLSSVGQQQVEGQPARWIEVRKETARRDGPSVHLRKLLVLENSLAEGKPTLEAVAKVLDRDPENGEIHLLTGPRLRQFLLMGMVEKEINYRVISADAPLETGAGTWTTRYCIVSTPGNLQEHHIWFSTKAPFGWVRLEIKEAAKNRPSRVVFSARLNRQGTGALSEMKTNGGHVVELAPRG